MKKLGFGLMRLPLTDSNDTTSIELEEMKRMVDVFMKRGFTYFDTAYPYHNGHSEVALREAVVKRYDRDRFTVTDKMPCWAVNNEADLERIFNEQLERCGVDYFDYYWLHAMNKDYVKIMDRTHGWEFVQRKKTEGKIRHIGFSFHDDSKTLENILKAHPEMEYVQLQINYIDWSSPSIEAGTCYNLCEQYGKQVIVMEPVKGGSLAQVPDEVEQMFRRHNPEASPASWAIRYVASLPNVMMVLSGMSNVTQMEDNTSYMENFRPLDNEETAIIARAAGIIKNNIDIPCTACHYCTDGCPMSIAIPEYFGLMNTRRQFGDKEKSNTEYYYKTLTKTRGKASDCIECGQCESHCPQHLPIISELKRVAEMFG